MLRVTAMRPERLYWSRQPKALSLSYRLVMSSVSPARSTVLYVGFTSIMRASAFRMVRDTSGLSRSTGVDILYSPTSWMNSSSSV